MLRSSLLFVIILALSCRNQAFEPHQRDCFFTQSDLVRLYPHLKDFEFKEESRLTTFKNRKRSYEYRLTTPDSGETYLAVDNQVFFTQTQAAAKTQYRSLLLGHRMGPVSYPADMSQVPGAFSYGQESFCSEYEVNGKPYGLFFLAWFDKTVFMFSMSGMYMEQNELARLLNPLLECLKSRSDSEPEPADTPPCGAGKKQEE